MSINKTHAKNKDHFLDKNGPNEVSAGDAKNAIVLKHENNKDTILDQGGPNEISAANIKIKADRANTPIVSPNVHALFHLDNFADGVIPNLPLSDSNYASTGRIDLLPSLNNSILTSSAQKKFGNLSFHFITGGVQVTELEIRKWIPTGIGHDPFYFNFENRDFTIECWIRLTDNSQKRFFLCKGPNPGASPRIGFSTYISGDRLSFDYSTDGTTIAGAFDSDITTFAVNTWYHIAFVRDGNVLRFFRNGQPIGTGSITGTIFPSDQFQRFVIGAGTNCFIGYMDELQISIDTALYKSAFNVPVVQYPLPELAYIDSLGNPIIENPLAIKSNDILNLVPKVSNLENKLNIPSGINQAAAGVGPGELWADSSDGFTVKLGQ